MKILSLVAELLKIYYTKGNLVVTIASIDVDGSTVRKSVDDILSPSCKHLAKDDNWIELWSYKE